MNPVSFSQQFPKSPTIADRDHELRLRHRRIGPLEGGLHMPGHRAGDQQEIGMARRGHEAKPQPFERVIGVIQGVDLELTAVAGAGIDVADREAVPETRERRSF